MDTIYVMSRTLAEALSERCGQIGLKPDAASLSLGLAKNAIWRWSNGTEPGPMHYAVLMEFLGVSLEELGSLIAADKLKRWEGRSK